MIDNISLMYMKMVFDILIAIVICLILLLLNRFDVIDNADAMCNVMLRSEA